MTKKALICGATAAVAAAMLNPIGAIPAAALWGIGSSLIGDATHAAGEQMESTTAKVALKAGGLLMQGATGAGFVNSVVKVFGYGYVPGRIVANLMREPLPTDPYLEQIGLSSKATRADVLLRRNELIREMNKGKLSSDQFTQKNAAIDHLLKELQR